MMGCLPTGQIWVYGIAENFRRRKLLRIGGNTILAEKAFANWWKYDFGGESFCGLFAGDLRDAMSPNFAEKTFTNSHKTLKFSQVSSLKSFLLCGSFQWLLNWLLHKWREGCLLPTWAWKVSLPNVAVYSVAIAVGCDWFLLLTGSWRSWWPRQK